MAGVARCSRQGKEVSKAVGRAPVVAAIASPAFKANPWHVCAELRSDYPISEIRMPGGLRKGFLVTRYHDAVSVLSDGRFLKTPQSLRRQLSAQLPWSRRVLRPLTHHMLDTDGAEHHRLRATVSASFSTAAVGRYESRVQDVVDELLDEMASRGEADLVRQFARRLPLIVMSEMLGLSVSEGQRFAQSLLSLVAISASHLPMPRVAARVPDLLRVVCLLHRAARRSVTVSGDSLIGRLQEAGDQRERLTENELVAMLSLFLVAGYETVANLIASALLHLLTQCAELGQLRDDPGLMSSGLEELLRLTSPVDVTTERYAQEDVEVAGVHIRRGSLVLVALVSANRDEAVFDDPLRLSLLRTGRRHLAFGMGTHYCLGAALARLEGRLAIAGVIQRFPGLRLAVPAEQLRWRPGLTFRGLSSLPVLL